MGYSPDSNYVSIKDEEYPMLRFIIKQWLVKTLQAGEDLECSDLLGVEISDSVIVICSYDL
jgi:hypothetical protein